MPDARATDFECQQMRRALKLAERGRGWAEPGALVGCVLLGASNESGKPPRVIGEGWYERYGGPHAEINAIAAAEAAPSSGGLVRGSTAVVTLEPCAHYGKTPPCADRLIDKGVARVVVGLTDPFGQVNGLGLEKLRDAGVEVVTGVEEAAVKAFYAPWIKRVRTGLPWVICKWAQTLDGRTATASGDSQWISNAASRRRVHELRATVDAIVVGVGTVIADDPQLTARDVTVRRAARRVVIDPDGRMPRDARMLDDGGSPVMVAVSHEQTPVPEGAIRLVLPAATDDPRRGKSSLDMQALLRHLAEAHDAATVLVEGGAATHAAFVEQSQVDELHVYIAPKLAGDPAAKPALTGLPLESMAQTRRLHLQVSSTIPAEDANDSADLLLVYRINRDDPG